MEALAVTLGVTPHLAGRTFLAVGLLCVWYAVQAMFSSGEFSWRMALLGVAGGLVTMALQLLVHWARAQLDDVLEAYQGGLRKAHTLLVTVLAMALLIFLLRQATGAAVADAGPQRGMPVLQAGFTLDAVLVLVAGSFAYAFARVRSAISELFSLLPLSDERGVRRVLFVGEALWTVGGILFALLLPVLGAVSGVVALLLLLRVRKALQRATSGARGPCPACQTDVHLAASVCPKCRATRTPRAIGWFGRVLAQAPADPARHRIALLVGRRCPTCAERLETKEGSVVCPPCGQAAFRDADEARAFLRHVDTRTAALAPLFALVGLVPVLGLGFALVLYKLSPGGALGGYVHWTGRFLSRFLRGLALLGLALVQPVPLLGALAALGIVSLQHLWLRHAFLASLSTARQSAPSPASAS